MLLVVSGIGEAADGRGAAAADAVPDAEAVDSCREGDLHAPSSHSLSERDVEVAVGAASPRVGVVGDVVRVAFWFG